MGVLNGMTLQQNAVMVSFVLVNIAQITLIISLILSVQKMVKNRFFVDRKRVKIFVAKDYCVMNSSIGDASKRSITAQDQIPLQKIADLNGNMLQNRAAMVLFVILLVNFAAMKTL